MTTTTSVETSSTSESSTSTDAADTTSGGSAIVNGGVEKGPFVLGSTVSVDVLDIDGNPTGVVFNTQTDSDRGEFEVPLDAVGLVSISGEGFYFDEVTGSLSDAQLTLRALAEIEAGGAQTVYLNLVTHLSYLRVQGLVAGGMPLAAASSQTELALRDQLAIGPTGFDPGADGIAMTLLGGDNDANAYSLAVGAVLLQAAVTEAGEGGPVDATFQQLINQLSDDFADDAVLNPTTLEGIAAAEIAVDGDAVMAALQTRFDDIEATEAVPNIQRVLDPDRDDLANIDDNCWYVANPDQADVDTDGIGDACDCGNAVVDVGEDCDDGNAEPLDGCQPDCTASCEKVADVGLAEDEQIVGYGTIGEQVVFLLQAENGESTLMLVSEVPGVADEVFEDPSPFLLAAGMLDFDGAVFFGAQGGGLSSSLWRTDGTEDGTMALQTLNGDFVAAATDDRIYFTGGEGKVVGRELFASDGTAAGTGLVLDVAPGLPSSDPQNITVVGNEVWFMTAACGALQQQLWTSDGTAAGTIEVAAVGGTPMFCGNPGPLRHNDGIGYIQVFAGASSDLWRSDGTPAGTYLLQAGQAFAGQGSVDGWTLFFRPSAGVYRTDGTVAGTSLLHSAANGASLAGLGDLGVFVAGDEQEATSLWATDGTPGGTTELLALGPIGAGVFTVIGDRAFMGLYDEEEEVRVWTTDGTPGGTHPVLDLDFADPYRRVFHSGDHIYFIADDGVSTDPWRCPTN